MKKKVKMREVKCNFLGGVQNMATNKKHFLKNI